MLGREAHTGTGSLHFAEVSARGIKARIQHKSWGGGPPLGRWQREHNRRIARRRAAVETTFATLKRRMGLGIIRYVGLAKAAGSGSARTESQRTPPAGGQMRYSICQGVSACADSSMEAKKASRSSGCN